MALPNFIKRSVFDANPLAFTNQECVNSVLVGEL